jgi:hypothetical protein
MPPLIQRYAIWPLVCALALWHMASLLSLTTGGHLQDAAGVYLPTAKLLLVQGTKAYFASSDSLRLTPLSVMWPALFDADGQAVRVANLTLSGLTVISVAGIAHSIGGRAAALCAAFLWSAAPTIALYSHHAITEALYFFLASLWLWALLAYTRNRNTHALVASIIAGGLSILVRPLLLYPLLAVGGLVLVLFFMRSRWFVFLKPYAVACGSALVLPALYIAHNVTVHRFPSISTGAGAALFQGLHPLTHGLDAPRVGLDYDVTLAVGDHLSVEADASLRIAARGFAEARTWAEWCSFVTSKARAVLFFDRTDSEIHWRGWRIFLCVSACAAIIYTRRRPDIWFITLIALLCAAQSIPVLHNERYAVGALELWLIVLAAVGLGTFLSSFRIEGRWTGQNIGVSLHRQPDRPPLPQALACIAALGYGGFLAVNAERLEVVPDPPDRPLWTPLRTLHTSKTPLFDEMPQAAVKPDGSIESQVAPFALAHKVIFKEELVRSFQGSNLVWEFDIGVSVPNADKCSKFELGFVPHGLPTDRFRRALFNVKTDGTMRRTRVGAPSGVSLAAPVDSGVLRIISTCPPGTRVKVENIWFWESTIPAGVRAQALNAAGRL